MSDKNVCPYCGGEDIVAVWIRDAKYGEIRLKDTPAALCHRCKTVGPYAANEAAAIAAFCHPAHLMESLHTYDPEKQIVVSRDDLAALLDYWFGNCPNDKFAQACEAAAELHAALEVKP